MSKAAHRQVPSVESDRFGAILHATLTDEDLAAICQSLIEKAKNGNIQASRLIISYLSRTPKNAEPEPVAVERVPAEADDPLLEPAMPVDRTRAAEPWRDSAPRRELPTPMRARLAEEPSPAGVFPSRADLDDDDPRIWHRFGDG